MAVDDSYTKALLHCDGEDNGIIFSDEASHPRFALAHGNACTKTDNNKFGTASGYFDGNGDCLTARQSVDWDFGTGEWTVDFWVYRDGVTAYGGIVAPNAGGTAWGIGFGNNDGKIRVVWNSEQKILSTNAVANTTWTHVAVVRSSNTVTCYINGVANGTDDCTGDNIIPDADTPLQIGRLNTSGYYHKGNIDELRISKGIARWTENFTPPTEEYTVDSYTKLLLHMNGDNDGVIFTDESGEDDWAVTGNALTDTSDSKFGTASGYFDGNGDYIELPASSDFNFGAGDFTIDCWIKRNGTKEYPGIFYQKHAGDHAIAFGLGNNDNKIRVVVNSVQLLLSTTAVPDLTWTHIAIVRVTNTMTCYIGGEACGTADVSAYQFNTDVGHNIGIGRLVGGVANYYWNGWIDEFRISKGIARWTENFTPPTAAYSPLIVSGTQRIQNIFHGLRNLV